MIETPKVEYYLGSIATVVNKLSYEVTVNIPGFMDGLTAYPKSRAEMDEPKEGDVVVILSLDPLYHSVLLYEKLKEDEFIGFRSNGKMLEITPDYIRIGVFNKGDSYPDAYIPTLDSEIIISTPDEGDNYGEITIKSASNINLNCETDINIKSKTGDITVETNGNMLLKSPTITIDGDVKIEKGRKISLANTSNPAFNVIPNCPYSGSLHGKNSVIS